MSVSGRCGTGVTISGSRRVARVGDIIGTGDAIECSLVAILSIFVDFLGRRGVGDIKSNGGSGEVFLRLRCSGLSGSRSKLRVSGSKSESLSLDDALSAMRLERLKLQEP